MAQVQKSSSLRPLASYEDYSIQNEYISKENNIQEEFEKKYKKFNCSKDYLRTTINVFPKREEQIRQTSIPIGLYISPTSIYKRENDIPILNYGEENDAPRCRNEKCKAFMNPFVKFKNGGEKWECNFCKSTNKTSDYLFDSSDNNNSNSKIDYDKKIELNNGSYEFILNKSYWKNNRVPNSPNYYFLIDISYKAIESGFSQCVLETIKDCILNNYFYNYDTFNIKVCIMTYDTSIHFYSVNNKSNQFVMFCVNEDDIFIPTNKENLLISLKDNKNKLMQIIESIQNSITNNLINNKPETKNATKIFDVIKSVNELGGVLGGKILLFSGSNVRLLKLMTDSDENNKLEENESEYLVRGASNLSKLGIDITYNNFSVNVFQACNEYTKLISLNQICDNSNGNMYFYKNFNPDIHYKNIYNQIKRVLLNEMQLEGTLKIRLSNGYYISEYMTSVLLYNRKLFVFPCHDIDQKYSVQLTMLTKDELEESDDPIRIDDYVYIQSCFLYSHGDGTRRMSIHNLCLPVSSDNKNIFEYIDVEFLSVFYAQKISHLIYRQRNLNKSVIQIENNFYSILKEYFNNSEYSLKRKLSDNMELLCLYFLGIMKSCLFNKKTEKGYLNDIDLSNYFRLRLLKTSIEDIITFIYPRIYLLDNCIDINEGDFPQILNANFDSLKNGSLFLVDNGFYLSLYCTKNIESAICKDVFNVNSFGEINYGEVNENNIFDGENSFGSYKNKIREIIDNIRSGKGLFQDLVFVFEGFNDEKFLKDILIENNFNKNFPYDFNQFHDKIVTGSLI